MRFLSIVLTCVVISGTTAHAQLPVTDFAVIAKNRITAAVRELLLTAQRLQHARLRRMAQRLSVLTDLRKYAVPAPPRWRTHGDSGFRFIQSYNDALIFGDHGGAAYSGVTHPLTPSTQLVNRLPAAARHALTTRLATVELADATAIAGIHDTGQLRFTGRKSELPAIAALEGYVVDPSNEQSTTAVLDKISGAVLIGARQRQARAQLLTGIVEQLLVDTKRARDTEAATMNMQLMTWRDRAAANAALVTGTGDALRTWRQP